MISKTRIPAKSWGPFPTECRSSFRSTAAFLKMLNAGIIVAEVIFRGNTLIHGVLDKSQVPPMLVHAPTPGRINLVVVVVVGVVAVRRYGFWFGPCML